MFCMEPFERTDEKPLDHPAPEGGYARIFRTIGCIGDSLSSGEFQTKNEKGEDVYRDYYEYSWGQYLARMIGAKVFNLSRGGLTARDYMEHFAEENGLFRRKYAAQAYIFALGVNDLLNYGHPLGSMADLDPEDWRKNADTFAGNYAKIVSAYREIEPRSVLFFMTMPRDGGRPEELWPLMDAHAALLYEMAEYFGNAYVIDFRKYGPVYDEAFRNRFYMHGHLSPAGYLLTAEMTASYIDYIVRHDMEAFKTIGLV